MPMMMTMMLMMILMLREEYKTGCAGGAITVFVCLFAFEEPGAVQEIKDKEQRVREIKDKKQRVREIKDKKQRCLAAPRSRRTWPWPCLWPWP